MSSIGVVVRDCSFPTSLQNRQRHEVDPFSLVHFSMNEHLCMSIERWSESHWATLSPAQIGLGRGIPWQCCVPSCELYTERSTPCGVSFTLVCSIFLPTFPHSTPLDFLHAPPSLSGSVPRPRGARPMPRSPVVSAELRRIHCLVYPYFHPLRFSCH